MKTTRLIGTEWKCGDTCSGCVLIGRGLFLIMNDRLILSMSCGAKIAARFCRLCSANPDSATQNACGVAAFKESSHALRGVAPAGLVGSALGTCHRHVAPLLKPCLYEVTDCSRKKELRESAAPFSVHIRII